MSNRDVPSTNNESERSLRPCVTYRKIPNGFRSQWAAIQYGDIRSAIETARRQSINPLKAIQNILATPTDAPLIDTG